MAMPDFKSLLASQQTGTGAAIGAVIASAAGSKNKKRRLKQYLALLGTNIMGMMDQNQLYQNMTALQRFEDRNQDNLEYINQRGVRRQAVVEEAEKYGGKLIPDGESYKWLNEEEMKFNWTRQRSAERQAMREQQDIQGPFSDALKKQIDEDAVKWLQNLNSRANNYDWSRTDKGLMDNYTRSLRDAQAFYGDPRRQGRFGRMWNDKFGGGEAKRLEVEAADLLVSEINKWKEKDKLITSVPYATSEKIMSDHNFNTDEYNKALSTLNNNISRPPEQSISVWLNAAQKEFSTYIKEGTPRDEAFFLSVTAKAQDVEHVKYTNMRRQQNKILNGQIRADIRELEATGPRAKELQTVLAKINYATPDDLTNFSTIDTEKQEALLNTLRTNDLTYSTTDQRYAADALKVTYGIPEDAVDALNKQVLVAQTAFQGWKDNKDGFSIEFLRQEYPRMIQSEPVEMFPVLAGQYLEAAASNRIAPSTVARQLAVFNDDPTTPAIENRGYTEIEWAQYKGLMQLRVEMEAAGRLGEYKEFIESSGELKRMYGELSEWNLTKPLR